MATNTTDLTSLFKSVYGDKPIDAVPEAGKLQKDVPFRDQFRQGDDFEVPVILSMEGGFSYAAKGDGSINLNNSVPGSVQKAKVTSNTIYLRSQISYQDMMRAAENGSAAFSDATSLLVENMLRSMGKRVELMLLYGQQGLGQVSANDTGVLTITDASWGAGIWAGLTGAVLEAWDGIGSTQTKHNGDLTISSISVSAKTVTVTGTSDSVVANDYLYFKGARTASAYKECAGVDKIITNSGSLFNIDAGNYELFRGQQYPVNGALNLAAVELGSALAVNFGLDEDAKLYCSPSRWATLNSNEAALRRYSGATTKAENGSEELQYHFTGGVISIVSHPYVKDGDAFLLPNPAKRVLRFGATLPTFNLPMAEGRIFFDIPDYTAKELRLMTDQAIFITVPAQCVKFTGITA